VSYVIVNFQIFPAAKDIAGLAENRKQKDVKSSAVLDWRVKPHVRTGIR
jgi:hypothetical protein